jgi:hypothetical protein
LSDAPASITEAKTRSTLRIRKIFGTAEEVFVKEDFSSEQHVKEEKSRLFLLIKKRVEMYVFSD